MAGETKRTKEPVKPAKLEFLLFGNSSVGKIWAALEASNER